MRAVVGNHNNHEGRCACANKRVENERDDPASLSDYHCIKQVLCRVRIVSSSVHYEFLRE